MKNSRQNGQIFLKIQEAYGRMDFEPTIEGFVSYCMRNKEFLEECDRKHGPIINAIATNGSCNGMYIEFLEVIRNAKSKILFGGKPAYMQ